MLHSAEKEGRGVELCHLFCLWQDDRKIEFLPILSRILGFWKDVPSWAMLTCKLFDSVAQALCLVLDYISIVLFGRVVIWDGPQSI